MAISRDAIIMYVYWTFYLAVTQLIFVYIVFSISNFGFAKWLIIEFVRVLLGFYLLEILYGKFFGSSLKNGRGRR